MLSHKIDLISGQKFYYQTLLTAQNEETNVLLFLAAFEKTLSDQGFRLPAGAGVAAALQSYQHSSQPVAVGARK